MPASPGPDQQGTYESAFISLGAVRLKIIDMAAGEQPMVSEDGDTVLAFNGEIYNYRELRSELEARGHDFSTHSDTEVLLRAFLHWDTGCFRRLRGMFAVAVWVESQRRLVLARDRVGIKPLYIHRGGEDLYFGSELKSIFAHPDIPRQLDLTALHYYLALNYVPGPHTFPVGIWLSGGVDSSAVLHYAREVSASCLKTFSISFAGRSFDESRYAREIARRYNTEHYELDVNPSLDLPTAIEDMVYYSDEPFADAGAVPLWFLSMMSRRYATVALSGEGADELFGGYITYRADRFAGYARSVPGSLRRSLLGLLRYWRYLTKKLASSTG